jgi:hypothetical protein
MTDEEATRVEDTVHASMSLAQFMDLMNGSADTERSVFRRRRVAKALTKMCDSLRDWVAQPNFQDDLVPLEVLLLILLYEMNRPLELWYGYLPEFPSEEFTQVIARLPEEDKLLKERLVKYQEDCEGETGKSLDRWTKSRQSRGNAGGKV